MRYLTDNPILKIIDGIKYTYTIVSYHRNNSRPSKSKWLITKQDEVDCFMEVITEEWMYKNVGWGIRLDSLNKMVIVGKNKNGDVLKIGKFIGSDLNWHGYPANYPKSINDIPCMNVLQEWRKMGIIKKHLIKKVVSGKECNL